MEREEVFDQLLKAVLAMRQKLEQQVQIVDAQILQARLEHLRELLDRQQKELADWLSEIDQSLIDCGAYIQEYRRLYAEVSALSGRISRLAGASPPMSVPLPAESIEETIIARIQHLRAEGKI